MFVIYFVEASLLLTRQEPKAKKKHNNNGRVRAQTSTNAPIRGLLTGVCQLTPAFCFGARNSIQSQVYRAKIIGQDREGPFHLTEIPTSHVAPLSHALFQTSRPGFDSICPTLNYEHYTAPPPHESWTHLGRGWTPAGPE